MERQKITCRKCKFMKLSGRARTTGNNLHLKGARGKCVCDHPKAEEIFYKICPRSPRMAGFIGYTAPGEREPTIKTSPKWCPLRHEKE